jgi:hypothetical protein
MRAPSQAPQNYCGVVVAEEVVVDDASSVGTIEGLASMRTVRVDVAVRPLLSVAT